MGKIYSFIQSAGYRTCVTFIVCFQVCLIILFTINDFQKDHYFFSCSSFLVTLFLLIDYLLRLYVAPFDNVKLSALASRVKYAFSFMGIVDLFCALPFLLYYLFHLKLTFDFFDFARVILIFKIVRYSVGFKLLVSAISSVKRQLYTVFVIAAVFLIFASMMIYYLEREAQPEKFTNVGEGFWLEIITFTTVGYGDVYPVTPFGKLLGACTAIVGIFMIALPSGIISSAFLNQVQKKDSLNRKK